MHPHKSHDPAHIALFESARNGNARQITAAIKAGADARSVDIEGHSALYYAIQAESLEACEVLLNNGVNVNAPISAEDKTTPLQIAAYYGDAAVLSFLLQRGADPNHTDEHGRTALDYALARNRKHIVTQLEAITAVPRPIAPSPFRPFGYGRGR